MAKKRKLKYSENQFLYAARDSHEKAMKLAYYHVTILKAYMLAFPLDADYAMMYDRTILLFEDLKEKYVKYYTVSAAQSGETSNVGARIKNIKGKEGKARDWFTRVMAIYARTHPERVKAIFPHLLKPFYHVGKDAIIRGLYVLSKNIGDDTHPLMIIIKAEIDEEYSILNPDRETQREAIGKTRITSSILEDACKASMEMEYMNAGLLMNKHPKDENGIQSKFHDMQELQNRLQKIFNIHLDGNKKKDLVVRTFVFNSRFRGRMRGGSGRMYLSNKKGGTNSLAVRFLDGVEIKFTAADFGITKYGEFRFLTIINDSGERVSFYLQSY